ncbi:MAG: ABC transporter permease [Verrucomicrobiales bacterium]|nr:ABC transporter permease [Verrucomicrobiales bacterium]
MSLNSLLAIAGVVNKELYRRKDFYVLFFLTAMITLIAGSANFFNDNQIVRYLKEICLLLIWVASFVIAITMAARQIPAERENRTIFPLLAKPVSRGEVLVGKFLGCWAATGLTLLCFYAFFVLVTATREQGWPVLTNLQALISHWMMLGIVIALTLLGSLIFTAPSSTATFCFIVAFGILFVGRHLGKVALQMHEPARSLLYAIYFTIPQLSFFDIREFVIHNYPAVPWSFWFMALLYGGTYTAVFLVAAWLVFRRKPLN